MDSNIGIEPAVTEVAQQTAQTHKMVPQGEVNEIVKNAKIAAIEQYKREQSQQQTAYTPEYVPARTQGISDEDIKRVAGDEIKQHFGKLQKEAQERADVDAAQRIVSQFREKVSAGKDKYADFDTVTGSLSLQHYPNVVQLLAEHVDNVPDVLYHLARNRTKLHSFESLCAHNSSDAIADVKQLAESIKANNQASQVRTANSPLSQQRPSNTGMDSSPMSISDLKKKYKG